MEGHLYRRGKSQIWYLLYDEPSARGEKRVQRSVRIGRMSKGEAETRKREILHELDQGTATMRPDSTTVAEFLTAWLERRQEHLAATTHQGYEQLVHRHVIPTIGKIPLAKVTPDHIRRIYRAMHEQGLAPRTCLHVHRTLHIAFKHAARERKVEKDHVLTLVDAPRVEDYEVAALKPEQVQMLMEAAKDTRLEIPVVVTILTGMRRGELLALRWSNVDFERKVLFVAEALEQTRRYGVRFKPPKTRSSRRIIPLADDMVQILQAYKERQERHGAAMGVVYVNNDLVFPNPDGMPWPPDTFTALFAQLAHRVGLQGFRFHDLRHAFASLALANGVPIKEVQALLGHSSPVVTLSVYARVIEGMGREAVNGLARSLLPQKE